MTIEPKRLESLSSADLEAHSVWRFAPGRGGDETCLRPVIRVPVADLIGKLVATHLVLANGDRPWALVGNVDVASARLTSHVVTVSIERGGLWFHLARYHDFDYAERGPQALADFLGLRVVDVFPMVYDVSGAVRGPSEATVGSILAEPRERLTRAAIIALTLL